MKKLLILMLVLGLTSSASALCTTLQISVNGEKNPVDSQIIVVPSGYLELDIWTTADIPPAGEGMYALAVKTADATISGGSLTNAYWWACTIADDAV